MHSTYFLFEADFVQSLRCIPMQVRFKLDTCGVKLKLAEWNKLSQEERQLLVEQPCTTPDEVQVYRDRLHCLVLQYTGHSAIDLPIETNPAWMDVTTIPTSVHEKAREFGITITPKQWANQPPLHRFALIKLSRPSHENHNFLPAIKEFGLEQ
jgi:hypothetical protein